MFRKKEISIEPLLEQQGTEYLMRHLFEELSKLDVKPAKIKDDSITFGNSLRAKQKFFAYIFSGRIWMDTHHSVLNFKLSLIALLPFPFVGIVFLLGGFFIPSADIDSLVSMGIGCFTIYFIMRYWLNRKFVECIKGCLGRITSEVGAHSDSLQDAGGQDAG